MGGAAREARAAVAQMHRWHRRLRKGLETASWRGFGRVGAVCRPFSPRTLQGMKKALLAAVLVAISMPGVALAKKGHDRPVWCQGQPLPPTFEGMAFTGDGDTIYGVNFKPGIRLWGMNAPELRDLAKAETVPGMRARSLVDDLLAEAKHQVRCEPIEWDGYCRVVATCTTAKGVDLTLATLKAGLAYGFYLSKHPDLMERALAYSDAEAAARKAKLGLWPQWQGEKVP